MLERVPVTETLEPAGPRSPPPGAAAPSDAALAGRAARGDRRAFDLLVGRHQPAVIDAAHYFLGNRDDALDVAQEAFLKAFRALARFRGAAQFRTWLLRITLNTARSFRTRRRAKKRAGPTVSIHHGAGSRCDAGSGEPRELEIPDVRSAPDAQLERKELKAALENAIASLDDSARELIVLRDILGESYEAIATHLALPLGTVKSKVHRARLVLREKMAPYV